MSITDVLEIPENASEEKVYNCYVRMLESVKTSLERIEESHDTAADSLNEKCRQLEELRSEVHTEIVNYSDTDDDGNKYFYEALDRINIGNDIYGCKKAATILREYLINNPDSIMGETLLDILSEQFKV